MTKIQFTKVTNTDGILTKTITPDDKGGIIKQPAATLIQGKSKTISMPFEEFGLYLRKLNLNQALTHGIADHDGEINIVTIGKYSGQPGTITRSKDFFHYPDGTGLGMFDHDPKPGQPQLSPDKFLQILYSIYPDFSKLPTWTTPSTSACVFDLNGQQLTGEGAGWHMYFPFDPASKLPELSKWLYKKLWIAGHGRIFISKSGALLERTIFDLTVFSPERLDFVAGANCIDCEQRLPDPVYRDGLEVIP
jgi:hypothetical protein